MYKSLVRKAINQLVFALYLHQTENFITIHV